MPSALNHKLWYYADCFASGFNSALVYCAHEAHLAATINHCHTVLCGYATNGYSSIKILLFDVGT
jgi:hypothetical protein